MVPATGFLRLVELVPILANSYYRAARKIRAPSLQARAACPRMQPTELPYPSVTKCGRTGHTVVCDINGCLLRSSSSFFPYFMLVAFEGGSILRALLLLVAYPFLRFLNHDAGMRAMVFISFCGLKLEDVQTVARAVLPKFFLQELHLQAYEVVAAAKKKVVITSVPRLLVEGFLREYLNVDVVVGTELQMVRGRFTGFLTTSGLPVKDKALKEIFGDSKPYVGLGSTSSEDQHLLTLCKRQACASCSYRRNRCNADCPMAPYFPPNRSAEFQNVNRLFGVANVLKIIRNLEPEHRDDAMRSIILEAAAWAKDPVRGCLGVILDLQKQILWTKAELEVTLARLHDVKQQIDTLHGNPAATHLGLPIRSFRSKPVHGMPSALLQGNVDCGASGPNRPMSFVEGSAWYSPLHIGGESSSSAPPPQPPALDAGAETEDDDFKLFANMFDADSQPPVDPQDKRSMQVPTSEFADRKGKGSANP